MKLNNTKSTEEISTFIEQETARLIRKVFLLRPFMASDPDAVIKGSQLTGSIGALIATYNFIHGTQHTFEHWIHENVQQ